jgi:hypothetical protein
MSETHVQQPRGPASQLTLALAARAGLSIVYGNHGYLDAVVGVDDEDASAWLSAKLSSFSPLTAAIQNPSFPSALAYQLAKVNRKLPLLRVPHPLPSAARLTRSHGRLPCSPHASMRSQIVFTFPKIFLLRRSLHGLSPSS